MTASERLIRLCGTLYEMRDTARNFHGAAWPQKSADWRRIIEAVCEHKGLGTLEAAKLLAEDKQCPHLFVIEIMGAAVEMVEAEND